MCHMRHNSVARSTVQYVSVSVAICVPLSHTGMNYRAIHSCILG